MARETRGREDSSRREARGVRARSGVAGAVGGQAAAAHAVLAGAVGGRGVSDDGGCDVADGVDAAVEMSGVKSPRNDTQVQAVGGANVMLPFQPSSFMPTSVEK